MVQGEAMDSSLWDDAPVQQLTGSWMLDLLIRSIGLTARRCQFVVYFIINFSGVCVIFHTLAT